MKIRERKYDLYRGGEEIFALQPTHYSDLDKTKRDVKIASQLFDLEAEVIRSIQNWKLMPWTDVSANIENMIELMNTYGGQCKRLPSRLREFGSVTQLGSISLYFLLSPNKFWQSKMLRNKG